MANAVCRLSYVVGWGDTFGLGLSCYLAGADVAGGNAPMDVEVVVPASVTAAEARTAMSTAVANKAKSDHGVTVVGTAMLLPTFQKG